MLDHDVSWASGEAQLHIFQQEAIYISSKKDIPSGYLT